MSDTNTEPSTEPSTRNPLMCLEGPNAPLYRSKVECGHCSHQSEYYNAQGEVRRRCPCCRLNFGAPPVTMRKKPKGVTGISQAALRDMLKYGHNVSHLITDDSDEEEDEGELVEMPNFEEMFAGVTEFIIPDTWESLRITACETYGTTPHPIYGNFYTIRRKKDKSSATASEEKRKKKTETAVVPYQFVSYNDKAFHGIDVPEEAKVPKPWKQSKLIIEISYRRCWCCGTGGFDSALQRICVSNSPSSFPLPFYSTFFLDSSIISSPVQ